jgi:hypothetical protein
MQSTNDLGSLPFYKKKFCPRLWTRSNHPWLNCFRTTRIRPVNVEGSKGFATNVSDLDLIKQSRLLLIGSVVPAGEAKVTGTLTSVTDTLNGSLLFTPDE